MFQYTLTQLGKTQLLQIANRVYNNWHYLPVVLALKALKEKGVKLSTRHPCAIGFMAPFTNLTLEPQMLLSMGNP